MAHGYTFEAEGSGYRFFPDTAAKQTSGKRSNAPFFVGNGPIWVAIIVFLVGFAQGIFLGKVIALGIAGWLLYKKFGAPKPDATGQVPVVVARDNRGSFHVSTEAIVLEGGETINAGRINSLDISNEFDAVNASFAASRTAYKAGSGMAALDAIGSDRRLKAQRTRYILSVQHGPGATTLAKGLSDNGVNGLRADVQRVLQGQSLD